MIGFRYFWVYFCKLGISLANYMIVDVALSRVDEAWLHRCSKILKKVSVGIVSSHCLFANLTWDQPDVSFFAGQMENGIFCKSEPTFFQVATEAGDDASRTNEEPSKS